MLQNLRQQLAGLSLVEQTVRLWELETVILEAAAEADKDPERQMPKGCATHHRRLQRDLNHIKFGRFDAIQVAYIDELLRYVERFLKL